MSDLTRANKITAYWEGDGVAVGAFYKTHDKIATVKSNDEQVIAAGFVMPEGTDAEPVTAQQKLEAYKSFLMQNAAAFGIMYDPVDRRDDAHKYPSKYDEDTFKTYSKDILSKAVAATLEKVNNNVVANMIKAGHLPEGTAVGFDVENTAVEVTEKYNNGAIKYGNAKYNVTIGVGADKFAETTATVELVSGQLKKPRELDGTVLTMTGIKTFLIDNGVLPKIEKPKKSEEPTDDAAEQDDAPVEDAE